MQQNAKFIRKLPIPMDIKKEFPVTEEVAKVREARVEEMRAILDGRDSRLMLIIGPCSADREDSVMDYVCRLVPLQEKVKDKILIVPRIYTNKPRTNGSGYKGMLHQPDPNAAPDMLKGLIANGFAFINLISLILITPIVTFYMLRDWDTFVRKFEGLLPKKSKKGIMESMKEINVIIAGFIRGQLSVCLILGLYYSIGLKLVGLELGLLVGFIAGVISFIPYVGSITGFVLGIILAFAQFGDVTHVMYVVAVFLSGQFLEGNFLTPKLVGDSVGLHPVWVMFALLAGGVLLGFLGLMLAVPVAAIIGVLVRNMIKRYKQSSLYLE